MQDDSNTALSNDVLELLQIPNVGLSPTPGRLIIENVELENFKSYGGTHTVGPFHHRFSCVVGPNGSGKSNIIDALLFVFGRRGKQIRNKKNTDLIHRSAAMPNCNRARVRVNFVNVEDVSENEIRNVPGTEFSVSRIISLDGPSKYFIDDRTCTQKEIAALMASRGVDLNHNRFLILQGEIEQIALMKPTGRATGEEGLLEYLEDIIGSSRFVEIIESRQKIIEDLTQIVGSKREAMQTAQTQVDELRQPAKLAFQFCNLERQMLQAKGKLAIKNRLTRQRHLDAQIELLANEKREFENWKQKLQDTKKEKKRLENEITKQEEIVKKAKKFVTQADAEFAAFDLRDREIGAREIHALKRRQKLQKEIAAKEKEALEAETNAETWLKRNEELQFQIPQVRQNLEKLTTQLDKLEHSLESDFKLLREDKSAADTVLQPEKEKLAKLEGQVRLLETQVNLIRGKESSGAVQVGQQEEAVSALMNSVALAQTGVEEGKKAEMRLGKAAQKLSAESDRISTELLQMRAALSQTQESLLVAEQNLRQTKSGSTRKATHRILRAKEEGQLAGIVDQLWNLGDVPNLYQPAIAAASGNAETVVVQSLTSARETVSFVRNQKLGRVTCIVLEQIQERLKNEFAAFKQRTAPTGTKFLLDLIDIPDKKHELTFYFVVRDTLYCDDIDIARRVAFEGEKRWRVVTKDGTVLDKSGTMSGGGTAESTSVAKVQCQDPTQLIKEIEQYKLRLQSLDGSLKSLKNQKVRVDAERDATSRELSDCRPAAARSAAELKILEEELESAKKTLAQVRSAAKLDDKDRSELKRLLEQKKGLEPALLSQREIVAVRQQHLERVCKRIETIGGQPRKDLRNALEAATTELKKMNEELQAGEMQPTLLVTRVKKLRSEILPNQKKEMESETQIIEALQKEKAKLEEEATAVLSRKADVETILIEQTNILKEKQKALEIHEEAAQQSSLVEVDFQAKIQNLQRNEHGAQQQVTHAEKEVAKIISDFTAIPFASIDEDGEMAIEEQPRLKQDFTLEELDEMDELVLNCEIKQLSGTMGKTTCDQTALHAFQVALEKLKIKQQDYEEAGKQRDFIATELEVLQTARLKEFSAGFAKLALNLKEFYQMITGDGDAELEVTDPSDPFTGGVIFSVRPPRKSWKTIQNLSGGEKTLSSLSLVFALHQLRATPLYFLDEVDAALDYRNVTTIAYYIAATARNAQFIIISLRSNMFELADHLVGIFKSRGVTGVTCIAPDAFVTEEKRGALTSGENSG